MSFMRIILLLFQVYKIRCITLKCLLFVYLSIILYLSTYYSTYYALLNHVNILYAIQVTFYYILLFETQYIILIIFKLWCLRPVCKGLRTPILDLCKAVWLAIVNLRTFEHLDVQEGTQNDHHDKATCSAVFTLLYALISLLCSLFPMFGDRILLDEIVTSTLQHNVQRLYE